MTEIKVGDTFSAWEVIELSAPKYIRNGKGKPKILTPYWKCVCHCGYCDGIIREVSQKNLLAGKSNGCGRKSRIENGKNNKKTNEYIKIDDEWYAIDTTWDDPIIIGGGSLTDIVRYRYFLKGSGIMDKNHNPSNKFTTDGQDFELPTLSVKNYN